MRHDRGIDLYRSWPGPKGTMAEHGAVNGDRRPAGGRGNLGDIVAGWAVLALLVGAPTVVAGWGEPTGLPAVVVAGLWSITVVAGIAHVRVVVQGSAEGVTLIEVGIIPVIVLLPPHLAVFVGATAGLVAELVITRGQLRKVVFNTAWQVVGITAAAWTFQLLAGSGFTAQPRPLLAALVAAAVYVVINLVAIAAVIGRSSVRPWTAVVAEEAASSLLLGYGAALVGVVAAVMLVEAPWGLPLLALPALLYRGRARARSEGLAGLAAERDRFQRTVAGSSDGVVLTDAAGRVEVWNPAMAALSGISEPEAEGRTLNQLGWAELMRGDPPGPVSSHHIRVVRGNRALSVRSSPSEPGAADDARVVLVVRDVSRETELARLQEDLVTRVSHEIRTPLTTVMGLLGTLDRHWDQLASDKRRELVLVASRGARRLGRLVTNLESLARIEAWTGDGVVPVASSVRIDVVVDEVVNAPERSVAWTVDVRGRPSVRSSAEDVRLILENLVGNAELYGAPPVELVVEEVGDEVILCVSDHGPGVPAELRSQLFEPFAQGDDGLRRTTQGLGLGLTIVRALAAANGGRVAHEENVGGGSRFMVALPAARSLDARGDVRP